MSVVPHRFLFRFSMPIPRIERQVAESAPFLDLAQVAALPNLDPLDGATPFAKLKAGWNEAGIGFRLEVAGKKLPVAEIPEEPRESDGLQIWLDTRNTQTVHRATRFCHHFAFLPSARGEGRGARGEGVGKKKGSATSHQLAIAQAKEDAPFARAGLLRATAEANRSGYVLDAWIPAECLAGYDPESNPLLGFYYLARDAELGEQFLAVGREFPFDHDPSLWSTLELTR